jgi:THO complex subunit 4
MRFFVVKIMQSRPKGRRGASGRRASAPGAAAGTPNAGNAQNARQRYSTAVPESKRGSPAVPATPAQSVAQKIMVSGLPPDVNEEQIKVCGYGCSSDFLLIFFYSYQELFQSTVGQLSSVQLNFDAQGRSKGTATVIFQKKGDANKAFQQYNNRLIDGS